MTAMKSRRMPPAEPELRASPNLPRMGVLAASLFFMKRQLTNYIIYIIYITYKL